VSSLNNNHMPDGSDAAGGRGYWRSLEHLAESPQVLEQLQQEFAGYDPQAVLAMSRRGCLKLMAASLALAGLTLSGCRRWPERRIHPHGEQPEGTMPGVSQYYATQTELAGVANGILARSFDGRPIKIEGNALHPGSLAAADARAQASVLSLYDPDRSRTPVRRILSAEGKASRQPRTWEDFEAFARPHFAALRQQDGRGLAILSSANSSPTLFRLKQSLMQSCPGVRWHCWEPVHRDHEIDGARLAFGRALRPQFHLDRANIIAVFDADLLGLHPNHQRHAHDWAIGRRSADRGVMNRLYAAEANHLLTGSVADRRLARRPTDVSKIVLALAVRLGLVGEAHEPALDGVEHEWVIQLAGDLERHRGSSLLAAGPSQPPHVHALVHALNHFLGNIGRTIDLTEEPLADGPGCIESIKSLSNALKAGEVRTLLILGGNPIYDAPADAPLDLSRTDLTTVHLSDYFNETSDHCTWHLPQACALECWGDGRGWDGTYSVQQPLILPLFNGRSGIELLAMLLDEPADGEQLVRSTARQLGVQDEKSWRKLLHDGVLEASAWPPQAVTPRLPQWPGGSEDTSDGLELLFVPDSKVYDGRFANNGWLQELPDPMTKLTWDNAALISKADADRLGIVTGEMVEVASGQAAQRRLEIVAYIMPGLAEGTVVLPLGYGRTMAGHVGNGIGFDTYRLRSCGSSYIGTGASVQPLRRRYRLAMTQDHHLIDAIGMWGREKRTGRKGQSGYLVREAELDEYRQDRHIFHRGSHATGTGQLFQSPQFTTPHAWGMAIDMNSCTGCSACVVACQAENNVPIVGKDQVANKREMHWLRIDRYFKGPVEDPDTVHMPMACGHCETAPCEQVCPVAATVHDTEGLNVMVYNRCIGTRYCSNNCPYKVRRFNYFDFHATDPRGRPKPWLDIPDTQQHNAIEEIRQMLFNPDVTVRMRGVMEKCTYCTHRIQEARIAAKNACSRGDRESELIQDGEVTPACAGACPTQAIVFGDLNDPQSRVSQLRNSHRNYEILGELNLRARTHYLAKVRNTTAGDKAETLAMQDG
jgi:MoCo/4Fe-4S cofactor protein with predicted Tat translocation signal